MHVHAQVQQCCSSAQTIVDDCLQCSAANAHRCRGDPCLLGPLRDLADLAGWSHVGFRTIRYYCYCIECTQYDDANAAGPPPASDNQGLYGELFKPKKAAMIILFFSPAHLKSHS